MKKIKFLQIILLFLVISSCSKSNDFEYVPPTIAGEWKLTNVSGTFGGINHNFPIGMITWYINPENLTVLVVNNNTDPNLLDLLETGIYDYQYINNPESPCGQRIEIDGSVYGCYTFDNETLVIDQSIADGFAITLKR